MKTPAAADFAPAAKTAPLVSCLCPTYGRWSILREALAAFLGQTYAPRELVILNQHPVPIVLAESYPGVRVYNEDSASFPTLGDVRNRCLDLARGEYVVWWDDDDLWLPTFLSRGVAGIGRNAIFKPRVSYVSVDNSGYTGAENVHESSWLTETAFARESRCASRGVTLLLPMFEKAASLGRLLVANEPPTHLYRCGNVSHISGTCEVVTDGREVTNTTAIFRARNVDHGNRRPLMPASLSRYWRDLCAVFPEASRQFGSAA